MDRKYEKLLKSYAIRDTSHVLDDLEAFEKLLRKWATVYNLVSLKDLDALWERHILNCVPLIAELDPTRPTYDLGSGAGFPGLILGILGLENVYLVERTQKKCDFLEMVIRSLNLCNVHVINQRVETVSYPENAQFTARGFASLETIFDFLKPQWKDTMTGFFLKGSRVDEEVQQAQEKFSFSYEKSSLSSLFHTTIIKVWNLKPGEQAT